MSTGNRNSGMLYSPRPRGVWLAPCSSPRTLAGHSFPQSPSPRGVPVPVLPLLSTAAPPPRAHAPRRRRHRRRQIQASMAGRYRYPELGSLTGLTCESEDELRDGNSHRGWGPPHRSCPPGILDLVAARWKEMRGLWSWDPASWGSGRRHASGGRWVRSIGGRWARSSLQVRRSAAAMRTLLRAGGRAGGVWGLEERWQGEKEERVSLSVLGRKSTRLTVDSALPVPERAETNVGP